MRTRATHQRLLPDDEMQHVFAMECIDAVIPHLCMLMSDNWGNSFSGVLYEEAGRHFVLTASHCLDGVRDWDSLRISTVRRGALAPVVQPIGAARLLRVTGGRSDDTDVGVIELPPSFSSGTSGRFTRRESIGDGLIQPGSLVLVAGFPLEWIRKRAGQRGGVWTPTPLFLLGEVTEDRPVPTLFDPPIHADVDFFLRYAETLKLRGMEEVASPNLEGVSGGAIFSIPRIPRDQSVWDGSEIKLAGIQSSWIRNKFVRGKRADRAKLLVDEIVSGNVEVED